MDSDLFELRLYSFSSNFGQPFCIKTLQSMRNIMMRETALVYL